jgi:hypothetical protein
MSPMTKLRRSGLWLPKRVRELLLTRERPSKWDDMRELTALNMMAHGTWKHQMHEMLIDGQPQNIAGGLAGLEVNPSGANYPTVTITGTETSLWTPQTYAPVTAFQNGSKAYHLEAFGTATSAGTPGTESINPRVDVVGGSSLGISGATQITPTASETASPFMLSGRLILRASGATTSTMVGVFTFMQSAVTGGGGTLTTGTPQIFGGASVTWDNTALKGLWMGLLAVTSTTNTKIPQGILWGSWN